MDNLENDIDGMAARRAAVSVLSDILIARKPIDNAVDQSRDMAGLSGRNRAFARMMVMTALRRKGQLDDIISRAADKPDDISPDILRIILYVGITQILFMDTADHAAVDIAVRLTEAKGLPRQKGFVNAVLRRVTREGRRWVDEQDIFTLNFPDWIREDWINDYGVDVARSMASASLTEASLDITLKTPNETALWLGALSAQCLPHGTLRCTGGGLITDMAGFSEGAWWVQDASSAIPVMVMGDVSGKTVIDLCAAPGGKTMQLLSRGAHVISVDQSVTRIRRLKENLTRTKLLNQSKEIVIADVAHWKPATPADMVLIDAPCSATGTIRRHPDLMHTKTVQDRDSLVGLQARILDNAVGMVRAGGKLVYATCSLQKMECETQIESFLTRHPEFSRVPVTSAQMNGMDEAITKKGDLRILPHYLSELGGMDGFFVSVLQKN